MRVVGNWSNISHPPNSRLSGPPAQYVAMDDFLQMLLPGAYVGGIDLQDCFLQWLVAPSRRRYLGVRHPVTGVLGVYLFLPCGLGPSHRVERQVREGRTARSPRALPPAARD